jgi:2-C-methyl-D-erythritol 4-phosphate cytidylyltransferase
MPVVALVLAAGAGQRLGAGVPKGLVALGGETLLVRSVRAVAAGAVDRIVVVVPGDSIAAATAAIRGAAGLGGGKPVVVAGGATRVDSARLGLEADPGLDDDIVVVHDAARPLAGPELFERVIAAIRAGADAATVALPSADTIAVVDGTDPGAPSRRMADVLDRARLVRVQTPQAFRRAVLATAHRLAAGAADTSPTDDAGLVHRYVAGARIVVVPGDERNLKVTTPDDLLAAERQLQGT